MQPAHEEPVNLFALAEKLAHWYVGPGDAVYAVASYAAMGQVHPDREALEAAHEMVFRLAGQTSAGPFLEEMFDCLDALDQLLSSQNCTQSYAIPTQSLPGKPHETRTHRPGSHAYETPNFL